MEYRLVEIQRLKNEQIQGLALLHGSVMHTLLSDLGFPFLCRYYQIVQREPGVVGICVLSSSAEVLGWAIGSPYPDRITAQLRSPLPWFMVQILRIALTRPIVLWQLLASAASTSSEVKEGAIELTYIGVAAEQRKRGIGGKLLRAFLDTSYSLGYHSVLLSVEVENTPAVSMYEKAGFKVINTFREGGFRRHRMEVRLA